MYIASMFVIALISMIICHSVAKKRGANHVLWGVIGFIFAPFAIPFVFLLTNIKNTQVA